MVITNNLKQPECAICTCELSATIANIDELPGPERETYRRLNPQQNQIMRTPCGHAFHISCLIHWILIRRQCPICRSELPPLE